MRPSGSLMEAISHDGARVDACGICLFQASGVSSGEHVGEASAEFERDASEEVG